MLTSKSAPNLYFCLSAFYNPSLHNLALIDPIFSSYHDRWLPKFAHCRCIPFSVVTPLPQSPVSVTNTAMMRDERNDTACHHQVLDQEQSASTGLMVVVKQLTECLFLEKGNSL